MQSVVPTKPLENSDNLVLPSVIIHISFETLLATIAVLPKEQKWQLYQSLGVEFINQSAEAKAIARLQDEEDPTKWITAIEEDEAVNEQELNAWLVKKERKKIIFKLNKFD
jgi:hypothetical protein